MSVRIPSLRGRSAVVTGANTGIGYHTAVGLAAAGASVVLACRDRDRGEQARRQILAEVPGADIAVGDLDLADLTSVREFAAVCTGTRERLDILVNNAGIMGGPLRFSPDGFELQFATNYLGHFALTGLLRPLLHRSPQPRVVSLVSLSTRMLKAPVFDHKGEKYDKFQAYNQSKLANLMFAQELDRRAGPLGLVSVAAHPGFAATEIQFKGLRLEGGKGERPLRMVTAIMAQSPVRGADPVIYAAGAPIAADGVRGGHVYGPRGMGQMRGKAGEVSAAKASADTDEARRLFDLSEELTGVSFGLAAAR